MRVLSNEAFFAHRSYSEGGSGGGSAGGVSDDY